MFWTENHVISASINTLLEKEDVTLKELLNEEDILQECNTANKQLVEFLVRPNVVYELIQLIVEEPPVNVDLQLRYKYSSLASEVIASRIPGLINNIAQEPKVMDKLYSFLDGSPPLNPLLASFFAKTIDVLFTHSLGLQDWYTYQFRCLQIFEYFINRPDFIPKFLNHLGTAGILNALLKFTKFRENNVSNNFLTWLDSQQLIEKLIALICGTYIIPVIQTCDTSSDTCNEIKNEHSEYITQTFNDNSIGTNLKEIPNIELIQDNQTEQQTQLSCQESVTSISEAESAVQPEKHANGAMSHEEHQNEKEEVAEQENHSNKTLSQQNKVDESAQQSDISEVSTNVLVEQKKQSSDITQQAIVPESLDTAVNQKQFNNDSTQQSNDLKDEQPNLSEEIQQPLKASDAVLNKPVEGENKDFASQSSDSLEEKENDLSEKEKANLDSSKQLEDRNEILKPTLPESIEINRHKDCKVVDVNNDDSSLTNGPFNDKFIHSKYDERLEVNRSANASQLICNFISEGRANNIEQKVHNPLFTKSISEDTITHLLESMFLAPSNKRKIALINGIQVLLTLLNDKTGVYNPLEIVPEELNRITDIIIPFIPNFVQILKSPPAEEKNYDGFVRKAVGTVRLSIAHLFTVLVDTLSEVLANHLIKHDVFNILLDMFFEYDFNNFLHSSVESIVSKALQAFVATDTSLYRDHFVYQCRLLERLNDAWEKSETGISPRPGYMGHVIQMTSVINSCNICDSLEGEKSEIWEDLKSKLLRAMANQNMILATIHDDNDDNHMAINHDDDDDENQMDPLDAILQSTMDSFTEHDLSNNFVKLYGSEDSDNPEIFQSSWVNSNNMFDDEIISGSISSIFDANSSPWDEITSDNNMQSGWADFGSLQETAGLSTVPNTFTCEAFAAAQQKDGFMLCDDSDKFLDDFTEFRVTEVNIQRLEEIQADTALTNPMGFQISAKESAETNSPTNEDSVVHSHDEIPPNAETSINVLTDGLASVVIEEKSMTDDGSSGDAILENTIVDEIVNKDETNVSSMPAVVEDNKKEPNPQPIVEAQR